MKAKLNPDNESNKKYYLQRELNKRNYRPEKDTKGFITGNDCLRWMAERRYL
ncbi:MAG TPA: hypothetical protein VN258_04520 [Mobilitalea sp.]|nr:hypothetical protein [Mobilitalea sp.]